MGGVSNATLSRKHKLLFAIFDLNKNDSSFECFINQMPFIKVIEFMCCYRNRQVVLARLSKQDECQSELYYLWCITAATFFNIRFVNSLKALTSLSLHSVQTDFLLPPNFKLPPVAPCNTSGKYHSAFFIAPNFLVVWFWHFVRKRPPVGEMIYSKAALLEGCIVPSRVKSNC